ncbi:hypothetical protein V5O48_007043 [Marasmius crinis-equi]|uniref:VOC domain-containing protein n=1 Tax=Marasmius crinis-equi TaxID=585013 RepID=A0ABR3FI99_9AGAR
MPIDHTGIHVPASKRVAVVEWYEAALKPLGYKRSMSFGPNGEVVGFSDSADTGYMKSDWWITGFTDEETYKSHHAFSAKDRPTVDAFYKAAIAAGGKDNGGPGLRSYHPNYYAAFVLDPAGNNIEVVCHLPAEGN